MKKIAKSRKMMSRRERFETMTPASINAESIAAKNAFFPHRSQSDNSISVTANVTLREFTGMIFVRNPGKNPIHAAGVINDAMAAYKKTIASPIRKRIEVIDILFTRRGD
jgi:hypothetical protein